ncbi:MAG: VanZ family protein [Bacteroidales bacterium]|jgi:VanZ family protein|nr:VanZ family protein [Bacteroidales bacterium]
MFRPLIPAIIWTIVVLLLTGIPGGLMPDVPKFMDLLQPDKLVHLFIFGLWVFLFAHGISKFKSQHLFLHKSGVFSMFLGMIFGGFTEVLQYYVIPGRSGNIYDFIADALGCYIGYLIFVRFKQKLWSRG